MIIKTEDDYRIYKQSLLVLLIYAVKRLCPEKDFIVHQSVGKSTFCEIIGKDVEECEITRISSEMQALVDADIPLKTLDVSRSEAENLLRKSGETKKADKISESLCEQIRLCQIGDKYMVVHGDVVPRSGLLTIFSVENYKGGVLLRYPNTSSNGTIPESLASSKLIETLIEYKKWNEIAQVPDVFTLNSMIRNGKYKDIIHISESLHEKRLSVLADTIKNNPSIRLVLISGPSSSGKTSFARRLSIHLRVNGLNPVTISLDDYFVSRAETPIDEFGQPDFEALEALDYKLFNNHISELIAGKKIVKPIFDFHTGARRNVGQEMQIGNSDIIIVEGIHGLNEKLSETIDAKNKFKIYCTPLTVMSLDDYNPVSPTDTRFLRRMVRDHQFRSSDALNTFKMWSSVRRGEQKNIFPFETLADAIFNSSLTYEFCVIKWAAEKLLLNIDSSSEYFAEAQRLLGFLENFENMPSKTIPPTSIIKEFIGGSSLF